MRSVIGLINRQVADVAPDLRGVRVPIHQRGEEVQGLHGAGIRQEPDQSEQSTGDAAALVYEPVPGFAGSGAANETRSLITFQ